MKVAVLVFLSIVCLATATTVLTRHQEGDLLPSSAFEWKHVDIADKNYTVAVDPLEWNHYEPHKIRFVCRALHLGQWIPGYMQHGRCYVSWRRKEHGKKRYDVLIGVQGAGRTRWQGWKAGEPLPDLAVTTGSYFITRHWDEILERYVVGSLSMYDSKAKAFLRGKPGAILSTGDILTEMEPIKYELENMEAPKSNWVIQESVPVELAKSVLENTDSAEQDIFQQVDFRFSESLVMDKLTGMKPGLIMKVKMSQTDDTDGGISNTHLEQILDEHDYYVGVDLIHDHAEQDVLIAAVPPGSNATVSLVGNYKTYLIPYKATVKAFYDDGETMHWKGSGNIMFKRLEDLQQVVTDIASPEDFADEEENILEHLLMVDDSLPEATEIEMITVPEEEFVSTTLAEDSNLLVHPEDKQYVEQHATPKDFQGTTIVVVQEPPQLQTEVPLPHEAQHPKNETVVHVTTKEPEQESPVIVSIYRHLGIPEPEKTQYKKPRSFLPMISLKEFFGESS